MPILLGLMDLILPYGYLSVALLTVVAAVVIGAFWVGWGLLAPAGQKKKKGATPAEARSPTETGEKGGAFAGTDSVPAVEEEKQKRAVTGMSPPPTEATVEGEPPFARDLSAAAPAVEGEEKFHHSVGVDAAAFVSGVEKAQRDGDEVASAQTAPAPASSDNRDAPTEIAPAPAASKGEHDTSAAGGLVAAHRVEWENKVHQLVEQVGVPSELPEEETDVPEEDGPAFDAGTRNNANWPTRIEPADKLEIQELTLEELKAYDGSVAERPLLLAIKGNIYDVSKSWVLYGPGRQYELFGGRDVTRALALMSFELEDLTGKIDDLKKADLEVLGDWEQKFTEKYPRVGRLVAVKSSDGKQQP